MPSWDGLEVEKKFSQANAVVSGDYLDAIAPTHFTDEAFLYWMPEFFRYLKEEAEEDSHLFEVFFMRLGEKPEAESKASKATPDQRHDVLEFLKWCRENTPVAETYAKECHSAVEIWAAARDA